MSRRGSTLVFVLWTLVLAGGVSLALSTRARSAMDVAANARAGTVARYAAESGVIVAVHALEDTLAALSDSVERFAFLNSLERAASATALGAARVQVAIADINAKLDINWADSSALAGLFAEFTDLTTALNSARAIRTYIGTGVTPDSPGESFPAGQSARYLTSLDDVLTIPGVSRELLLRAAPYLTVDGDGATNRTNAPPLVLRAARGAMVDAPSRLLIVSRGWLDGSALTHEIQAVYAVQGNDLALVRWREQTR